MADFSYDRLCGVQTIQNSFGGIKATLQLPSSIVLGSKYINGALNTDYANWYLLNFDPNLGEYVECGVSYSMKNGADPHWRIFMNTGAFYWENDHPGQTCPDDGSYPGHWLSIPVSDAGLSFGLGSTITMQLTVNGYYTTFQVTANGKTYTKTLQNYHYQSNTTRYAYTMGCKDEHNLVSHSTATFSNVQLYNTNAGGWDSWGSNWGYSTYDKRTDGQYGVYTRNPLSAYQT